MKKNNIINHAVTSVIQTMVTAVSLVLLYKLLLKVIGVEQLGIWSLVLATTSAAQLASLGITEGIVKFIAKYRALNEEHKLSLLIETAAVSITLIFIPILLVAYPLAVQYLKYAIQGELYQSALSILPYALVAYWIAMLTGVFQAGLYGCQLISYRNYILIGDSLLFLVISYFSASRYGLAGLAFGRVIQNLISMVASWMFLKSHIRTLPLFPYRWDRTLFREIIGYSINFQIISILAMLCDPLTKGLLSRFGSPSMVGYYEMANRLVQQVRSLIVSANQVLVPAFARLKELEPQKIETVYLKSYRILFFISLPLFSLLVISAPFVSEVWIGRYESTFVASVIILSIGCFLNTLTVPAYHTGVGTGELRWNVISHITMAAMNAFLGFLMGQRYGGIGVIIGWSAALAIGGMVLSVSFHKLNNLSMAEFLPRSSRGLAVLCLGGVLGSILGSMTFSAVFLSCFVVILVVPLWIHPFRKELMRSLPGLRKKNTIVF